MIATEFELAHILDEMSGVRRPLIEHFYHQQGYKIRCGREERLFALNLTGEGIVAGVRLVPMAEKCYWLRNLLVAKAWQGRGLGRSLMKEMLAEINPACCYCFALHEVVGFYKALGFKLISPSDCLEAIAQQYLKYKSRGRDWRLMGYALTGSK